MQYLNLNDETLVMLTLAGEQQAYEVLVKRYEKSVMASAFSVTRNSYLAEDAAQDAFVTAWMKLDRLSDPKKYSAWVCRIAENCAINILRQYKGFSSLEYIENYDNGSYDSPEDNAEKNEEISEIRKTVEGLPKKVKKIIHLYYFEGLSIVEIAEKLSITEGTVKSGLHDGRKKIRKELCAMDEKWNDTLVEKVMKKVAELKLWQFKSNKEGFEKVYKEVLKEVEELPESDKKYHALADVLMTGWWWLPGTKNDSLIPRIKEAAELGHNEDVMDYLITRERRNIPYYDHKSKIEFIRDKQIPYLEEQGFKETLASAYFHLGQSYINDKKIDEGKQAIMKAKSIASPSNPIYSICDGELWLEDILNNGYKDKQPKRYAINYTANELKILNGAPRYLKNESIGEGYITSVNRAIQDTLETISRCDCMYFDPSLKVGEYITGSNGTTLTFENNDITVTTPAGRFDGCQLWVTKWICRCELNTIKVYYKSGIGIVKYSIDASGNISDTRELGSYKINGGSGLLPLKTGNTWEYVSMYDEKYLISKHSMTVTYADEEKAIITEKGLFERISYDENSWLDMIEAVRGEYCEEIDDEYEIRDVSHYIERAEALAKTPIEIAHTKAAASVMKRIMATDSTFNPERKADGFWNFFMKWSVYKKGGDVKIDCSGRWDFEWKNWTQGCDALCCNHIYGILQDTGRYFWSYDWKLGAEPMIEYSSSQEYQKTVISFHEGGTVETPAGTFENCFKILFDIKGTENSWDYRGGNKEYYFAEGIGIVKTVNRSDDGNDIIYLLTHYEGRGEGYMPICGGLIRRYEALGLTDGFEAWTEYTYVEDENGEVVIFADKCGIKNKQAPITLYSSIQDEVLEDELWNKGEWDESRLRHDINNVKLILHYIGRYNRGFCLEHKAAAMQKQGLRILESLSVDGEIAPAWIGAYCRKCFAACIPLFGCGLPGCKTPWIKDKAKEEAYELLDKCIEYYKKWRDIPDGELLSFGDDTLFSGIKLVKGKELIELPDGRREGLGPNGFMMYPDLENMYYGMTHISGWEWFNPVRKEDRFLEYTDRIRELLDEEETKKGN